MLLERDPGKCSILPMVRKLVTGRNVIVGAMTDGQLAEIYCMIQEAAENGNGFGIDELLSFIIMKGSTIVVVPL
jgi:hypothetical protein